MNFEISQKAAIILLVGVALRVLVGATLGMTDDEAWYWAISQHLQMSYVVLPPLCEWLIHFATAIFGNTLWGARVSGIICTSVGAFFLVLLVERMGARKTSWVAALLMLICPLFFLGGLLAGPDLPLFCFWSLMMFLTWEILNTPEKKQSPLWVLLGITSGLAFLSKYTAILAMGAAFACFLWSPQRRTHVRRCLTISLPLALLFLFPVLWWNAQNDWVSFRFQFHDRHARESVHWGRWGVFWISQLALYGPVVFFSWFAMTKKIFKRDGFFLAIWGLAPASVFFIQPLFSTFKIHWALYAFIPVVLYLAKTFELKRLSRAIIAGHVFTALITVAGMSAFYTPWIPRLAKAVTGQTLDPKVDVSNDTYGWKNFRTDFEKFNSENLPIVTNRYTLAAQVAFAFKSTRNIDLIPAGTHENKDWGSLETPPPKFWFIGDNRHADNPEPLYLGFHCMKSKEFEYFRSEILAKVVVLHLCKKNIR